MRFPNPLKPYTFVPLLLAIELIVGMACGSDEEEAAPAPTATTSPAATPVPTEAMEPTDAAATEQPAAQAAPEATDGPVLAVLSGKQGGVINMVNYADVELFDAHAAGTLQSSQFRSRCTTGWCISTPGSCVLFRTTFLHPSQQHGEKRPTLESQRDQLLT